MSGRERKRWSERETTWRFYLCFDREVMEVKMLGGTQRILSARGKRELLWKSSYMYRSSVSLFYFRDKHL